MSKINYTQLKAEGKLLNRHGASEFYSLDGSVYQATWRTFGGFVGTGGWHVKEIGCGFGKSGGGE